MSKSSSGLFHGTTGEKADNHTRPMNGTDYNLAQSSSVGKVDSVEETYNAHSISSHGTPNSVSRNFKNGSLSSERYYDPEGNAYLDDDSRRFTRWRNHQIKKEELLDYIQHGREVEFRFNGKMYSITYGRLNGRHVISFCEFYKETTEVDNAEDILSVSRDGVSVLQMLESLTEDDIWIY